MSQELVHTPKPEYALRLQLMQTKDEYLVRIYFNTIREFATYQYVLNVTRKDSENEHEFSIGGLSIPKMKLPTDGTAVTFHDVPISKTYSPSIRLKRKQSEQKFTILLQGKAVEVQHEQTQNTIATVEVVR